MPGDERSFGNLLRRHRLAALLTQEQLAERAHLSHRTISDLERGAKQTPRRDTVLLLVDALELSADDRAALVAAAHPLVHQPHTAEVALDHGSSSAGVHAILIAEGEEQPVDGRHVDSEARRPIPVGGFLGALPAGPLVARDDELRTVLSSVDAVAGGEGRLLFLVGEPGVGKTRLAQQVSLHLRERGFLFASGRCYEPQEAVPFYPFLEALEALYLAAPPTTRSLVSQRWRYLGRLLPNENLPVPPSSRDGGEEQERLFWSVAGFLQALAEECPVALLLDDLHWADTSSLALLQHLARHTRPYSVLLLGTYRDVEVDHTHPLERALRGLQREQLAERVAIRRLGQEGTRALVATRLGAGEISDELTELIHRRTEGNPFFTQEVLHALVERGDVYRLDDHWERREIEEISVPESVRSAIWERVSRLSAEVQELLLQASVLGQSFAFEDLQAMGSHTELDVEVALEAAETAGLVRAASPEVYSFSHALTQQALYAWLSHRRKRRLHRAAGEAIAGLREGKRGERAAELAWHFVSGDDPERALPYALEAGDQAAAVFAHAEAERHYRMALELARDLEDGDREPELQEKLGQVLVLRARFDEALEVLERAVDRYHAEGDLESEVRATISLADALSGKGRVGDAVTRLEHLLEASAGAGTLPAHARLYAKLAVHLFHSGSYRDMVPAADQAVTLARAAKEERILAEAMAVQGSVLHIVGRINDACAVLDEAVRLLERLGAVPELRGALADLGETYLILGDLQRTRRLRERAHALAEQVGEPSSIAFSFANLGEIMFYLGDWPAARGHLVRSAGIVEGSELDLRVAYPHLYQGMLDMAEGKWRSGAWHLAVCLAVADRHGDLQALRSAHRCLAERELMEGRPEDALARLQPLLDLPGLEDVQVTRLLAPLTLAYLELGEVAQAERTVLDGLDRASRQSHRLALVDLLRVEGVLCARESRWHKAEQAFEAAVSLAQNMSYPHAQARALYEFGVMQTRMGETRCAHDRLDEALAIFQRLGADRDAERIRTVLVGTGA